MKQEKIQLIIHNLTQVEDDLRRVHEQSRKIEKKTGIIIQTLFVIIGSFALINLYFVNDLAQEIKVIVKNMNKMYVHFGEMSDRVDGMRYHIVNMGDNMALMPIMVDQMSNMSVKMQTMKINVSGMKNKIIVMRKSVSIMNNDISEMAGRFRHVNHNVYQMRRDVKVMSDIIPMR
jgi:DNA anti-recombination protein RmuC